MDGVKDKTQLDASLKALNLAVEDAIATRQAWMDQHMPDYAELKVGDEIYDLYTGRRLGVVSRLYRYWERQNKLMDTSMHVDYEFETSPGCFDNTSRQNVKPGSLAEVQQRRHYGWSMHCATSAS